MGCVSSGISTAAHSRLMEEAQSENAAASGCSSCLPAASGGCFRAGGVSEPVGRRPPSRPPLYDEEAAPQPPPQPGVPILLGGGSGGGGRAAQRRGPAWRRAEAARELTKLCGPQSKGHRAAAAEVYETECRDFARCNPKVAAAYARLAGELHDAERLAAGAFLVGLSAGLANTALDPVRVCKKVATEDWPSLEQTLHSFVWDRAVDYGGGTLEPQDEAFMQEMMWDFPSVKARAEGFFEALQPLAEALLKLMRDLRRGVVEVAGPLVLVGHVVAACTPPNGGWGRDGTIEQLAVDAFHIAHKADREADLAAIHFLRAALNREPRGAVQWHHAGHNLGIICLAAIGA